MLRDARHHRSVNAGWQEAAVAGAQEPPRPQPIDPLPPRPCNFDCWWPVGSVAQLDGYVSQRVVSRGDAWDDVLNQNDTVTIHSVSAGQLDASGSN